MGCGQSKIGIIYPRKNKRKGCNKKSDSNAETEEEADEADRGAVSPTSDEDEEAKKKAAAARIRLLVSPGPLLAHTEISSSQLDFFKMLDEKIENGPDYDSASEQEQAAERHRMAALIRDWESASSSSVRSLPSTPARKAPQKQYYLPHPHPQPVPLANGDLFMQQQYYQQFQQQQQYQIRGGQFFMPQAHPQYPRAPPQFLARNFHPQAQPPATAVVRYGRSRGVFTELA